MNNLVAFRCSSTAVNFLMACACTATLLFLAVGEPPPIYVFADSFADAGTNNFLQFTRAKCDFVYYGIDYPDTVATGRFSNGYTFADEIAKQIGYEEESPAPFLYLQSHKGDISKGVNFASAGAGILNITGFGTWIEVLPLQDHVQQFGLIKGNMTIMFGPNITADTLSKSLFLMVVGSNDILDYWRPCWIWTKSELLSYLKSAYQFYLKYLYDMGARRFGIMVFPPVGCSQFARAVQNNSVGCLNELNELARAFDHLMRTLLRSMSSELLGIKYSLGSSYI